MVKKMKIYILGGGGVRDLEVCDTHFRPPPPPTPPPPAPPHSVLNQKLIYIYRGGGGMELELCDSPFRALSFY